MNNKTETFSGLLSSMKDWYPLETLFDDFLLYSICIINKEEGSESKIDQEFIEGITLKYKQGKIPIDFQKIYRLLLLEMETRKDDEVCGNDVLGEFYEDNIIHNDYAPSCFNSYSFCNSVIEYSRANEIAERIAAGKPIMLYDLWGGSGRCLIAAARKLANYEGLYGIDSSVSCVRMTIINLFYSQAKKAEVLCISNENNVPEIIECYGILPKFPGIVRIKKSDSAIWKLFHSDEFSKEFIWIDMPQV